MNIFKLQTNRAYLIWSTFYSLLFYLLLSMLFSHLKFASFIWQAIFWLNCCAKIDFEPNGTWTPFTHLKVHTSTLTQRRGRAVCMCLFLLAFTLASSHSLSLLCPLELCVCVCESIEFAPSFDYSLFFVEQSMNIILLLRIRRFKWRHFIDYIIPLLTND